MLGHGFYIYLEDYAAVYVDIAKVASSSIKATLAPILGLDMEAVGGNPHEIDFPRPPESIAAEVQLFPGLYSFAFVRNPWDRLLSCYRDKIRGEVSDFTRFSEDSGVANCLVRFEVFKAGMTFEDFVHAVASIPDVESDEHFRSQYTYLTNSEGVIAADFVGRYENLESDFNLVAVELGLPDDTRLPRLQAARHLVDYVDFYTPALRKIVADRFAEDIDLLSYGFDLR